MAPSTCVSFDDDEKAQGDVILLFALLDRDASGYLDMKEAEKTRDLFVTGSCSMASDMFENSDSNNDGRINKEEWTVFLRALYEVAGQREWMAMMRSCKAQIYDERDRERQAAAQVSPKRKSRGGKKGSMQTPRGSELDAEGAAILIQTATRRSIAQKKRSSRRGRQSTGGVGCDSRGSVLQQRKTTMTVQEAATVIQAVARGSIARRSAQHGASSNGRASPQARTKRIKDDAKRDLGKSRAGRMELRVISTDAATGNRADFFINQAEIPFGVSRGDAGRGILVVIIDPVTETVVTKSCYDTVENEKKESCRLASDINLLPPGYVVLMGVKGYGLKNLSRRAVSALRALGAQGDALGREDTGWAFIGCTGKDAVAEHQGCRAIVTASMKQALAGERAASPLNAAESSTREQ
mmetsp:Transcript_1368/g.3676  ORF Transcript_1368/g.3676 Transcript_1368/m.3676 type:complete len:411 (-) Transcript_1368:97-1329(-)